jgi:hypothetical protein
VSRKVLGDGFAGEVIAPGDSPIASKNVCSAGSEIVDSSDLLDSPLTDSSSRRGLSFAFADFPRWRDTEAACERAARRDVLEKTALSVLMNTTELPTLSRVILGKPLKRFCGTSSR